MTDDHRTRPPAADPPVAGPAATDRHGGSPGPGLLLYQEFDGDSLYTLRAAVAAHASQAGLPPGRADDLVIAVHELASNAIRHGAGHGRVSMWEQDRVLHCEVADDGRPHDEGAAPPSRDAAAWPCEHGHGLWLVQQVADQAILRSGSGGTIATVSFTAGRRPSPLCPE